MDYTKIVFTCKGGEEWQQDLLIHDLANIGFDTFEDHGEGFNAYIPSSSLDLAALEEVLLGLSTDFSVTYDIQHIRPENWNAVWERNFEPIMIDHRCYVRATFHAAQPDYEYEIVIDPKMAFGTGHHQTTSLMIEYMLKTEIAGKNVLDMGCGTGILGILADKMGAASVTAIDYDPVCYESTLENAQRNEVSHIEALCGSKEVIPPKKYEVVFANINRNILLDQLEAYAQVLMPGGLLFLSGFYDGDDLDQLVQEGSRWGIRWVEKQVKDHWVAAKFEKN